MGLHSLLFRELRDDAYINAHVNAYAGAHVIVAWPCH
jgi:hypothetical protein